MKQLKMTTCVVLAILLVLLSTTAFAGTKYSDAIGFGTVLPKPTATPEPTEEPLPPTDPTEEPTAEPTAEPTPAPEQPEEEPGYAFERDAEGNLILNENGDPVVLVPEGSKAPTGFERDENGALVLDENGNPIPTFDAVEDEPAVEPTEEPVVEPTEEPVVEPEASVEPEPTVPADVPVDEPLDPEYLLDAEGNPVLDENGNPYLASEYTFDEFGNVVAIVVEEAEEVDPLEGLRQIMVVLHEGETVLPLYAEASAESAVVAEIPAGDILYVKTIEAEWSYAVYGEFEGYVRTSKIALYNEESTPEEEEIIRKITVRTSADSAEVIYGGDEITLYANLIGFEDDLYTLQWQYTKDGGATVCNIDGANDLTYSFIINDENVTWLWRICVTIINPIEISAESV